MSLEYDLGTEAHAAHPASVADRHPRSRFWAWVSQSWLWFAGLFIGLCGTLAGGFVFLACLILVIIGWLLISIRRSYSSIPVNARTRRIRLDIADQGMTEHDEDVQAFMPWSSMSRWKLHDGFIFIELRNHLSAAIPSADSAGRPINLDEIANLLLQRGVKERN